MRYDSERAFRPGRIAGEVERKLSDQPIRKGKLGSDLDLKSSAIDQNMFLQFYQYKNVSEFLVRNVLFFDSDRQGM